MGTMRDRIFILAGRFAATAILAVVFLSAVASGAPPKQVEYLRNVWVNELDIRDLTAHSALKELIRLTRQANGERRETYLRWADFKVGDFDVPPELDIALLCISEGGLTDKKMRVVLKDISFWQAFEFVAKQLGKDSGITVLDSHSIAIGPKRALAKLKAREPAVTSTLVEEALFDYDTGLPVETSVGWFGPGNAKTFKELEDLSEWTFKFFAVPQMKKEVREGAKGLTGIEFRLDVDKLKTRTEKVALYGSVSYMLLLDVCSKVWGLDHKISTGETKVRVELFDASNCGL